MVDQTSTRQVEGSELVQVIERANQVAATTGLDEMLFRTLGLMIEVCQARAGAAYLPDLAAGELYCRVSRGSLPREWAGKRFKLQEGPLGTALLQRQGVLVDDVYEDLVWGDELRKVARQNCYCLPLALAGRPVAVLQLIDLVLPVPPTLGWIGARMASEIDKAALLEANSLGNQRLRKMISIFGFIGATLDRDQILRMMIDYAREVIHAEACSLFLVDEQAGDIVLHLSTHLGEQLRVPTGKGIIGHVIQTGEVVLVPDVKHDQRHYTGVDQSLGFVTRAILAVPLRSRQVVLGSQRGTVKERIIGGFEAVNKLEGTFDDEDANLLKMLADQAATVLEIANLYADANELLLDVIKAMTAAIDAKDPYTEGHSQRVSNFAVEVARELGLPAEQVHQIRIGSLLHDVGKIGVPDAILTKPGRLTDDEFTQMKNHPSVGSRIMGEVRTLHDGLPALSEHHERLSGSGYPAGLRGEQISLFGRIVAVADVFDALTSRRPYREPLSSEAALDYLYHKVGEEFDGRIVDALVRSFLKGAIQTQREGEPAGED